jgi:hypothetical protein
VGIEVEVGVGIMVTVGTGVAVKVAVRITVAVIVGVLATTSVGVAGMLAFPQKEHARNNVTSTVIKTTMPMLIILKLKLFTLMLLLAFLFPIKSTTFTT